MISNTSIRVRRSSTILRIWISPAFFSARSGTKIPSDLAGLSPGLCRSQNTKSGHSWDEVSAEFSQRHQQIHRSFFERFEHDPSSSGDERRHLRKETAVDRFLFLFCEYSLESAALFNPSIVPHPDQSDLPSGALRFVLSLRATGEGHISSITFRTGIIHADYRIEVLPPAGFLTEPRQIPNPHYDKALFERKLFELGLTSEFTRRAMTQHGKSFSLEELQASLEGEINQSRVSDRNAIRGMLALAHSNYEVQFQPQQQLSERVLFPATPSQRNGIEDARFVRVQKDDGSQVYYATFTAFDGKVILPELVETSDFPHFRFITLNGPAAENKGMALFPRKIDGLYAMLSRQDNENIYIMFSDDVHFWNERQMLVKPIFPWELVQLGNCGSPIETKAGWLVLSHGVGPLRTYCIGAFLLDRNNPGKVIGRLHEPLLKPNQSERQGYVPNVVYTCGALVHNGELIIPYAMADHATGFATASLDEVLAAMDE